ncbi:MAG: hypothetical protein CM15mP89_1520 [Gammaproteobacteria bacterium]|nr:MAG: hypothetical protein CM15mP89_1520 [Gammaproteobacteria bacterium]
MRLEEREHEATTTQTRSRGSSPFGCLYRGHNALGFIQLLVIKTPARVTPCARRSRRHLGVEVPPGSTGPLIARSHQHTESEQQDRMATSPTNAGPRQSALAFGIGQSHQPVSRRPKGPSNQKYSTGGNHRAKPR